jgi:hypothetical protein
MIAVVKRMEDAMNNSNFKFRNIKFRDFFLMLILCLSFSGCNPKCGLVDYIFELAPDSRLPRWADFSGYQRQDVTMKINCCTVPWGGRAEILVYGPAPDRKILLEKTVKMRWHPLSDKAKFNKYPNTQFPRYSIININGVDEVFEQRNAVSSLYITDDPNITAYNNK